MSSKEYFVTDNIQRLIESAVRKLESLRESGAETDRDKINLLGEALLVIKSNPLSFDQNCQINIEWIARPFAHSLERLVGGENSFKYLEELYSMIYRFVREFEVTANAELSMELRRFMNLADDQYSSFSLDAQSQMRFANVGMPIQIFKRLLGSEPIRNLVNLRDYSDQVNNSIKDWDGKLQKQADRANLLQSELEKYAQAFNFVGLSQGFEGMLSSKRKDLILQRVALLLLGVALVLPVGLELWILIAHFDEVSELRWILLGLLVPLVSWTLLVVYFFRLVVRSIEGIKSQILQLELRRALCQFVESYVEYAKSLRKESPEILTRFESIVFSNIVPSEEKIPATFDGLDQLTNFVKSLKS